jgi:hypothetical protein
MNISSTHLTSIAALAACALFSGVALAEGGPISGSISLSYTKQETLPVTEAPGHMVLLGEVKGANRNTGGTDFMDGAEVTNREIARLFQGNGPHSGYITLGKDGNTAIALWSGQVTTVMSSEGQPQTSVKGNWEYVFGTGKYNGIRGQGEYRGHFTSQTSYVVDWSGKYSVDK